MPARTQVLCITVDAGDQELIQRWAQAGWLPTFRSLLARSTRGVIKNPAGPLTGAVWPSLNTGVSPARHGRYWYRQLHPRTYTVRTRAFADVNALPFWEVLSRAGRRVATIDQPEAPPSRELNGIQVADWGTHARAPGTEMVTWPRPLAAEVQARFGQDPVGSCDDRIRRGASEFEALRNDVLARVARKAALSTYFLDQGGWDLFCTSFAEAHCAGHQFWHLHDQTHPAYDERLSRSLGDPVADAYRTIDAALGRFLEGIEPDTTVLVVCSHGMGPCYGGNFLLDEVLRRLDRTPTPAPHRRARDPFLWTWQRTPTRVRSLLMPLRNRLVHQIKQAPTRLDGTRTYFQIPTNDGCGGVRINLTGREPQGQVHPGAEYDALCATLSRDLLALRNCETGAAAVRQVLRTTDVYGASALEALPDLLIEWNRDAAIASVTSAQTGRVDAVNLQHRTGDHKSDGLLLALGPSIPARHLDAPVSVTDIAPTITALLGVSMPDTDGRPIAALARPSCRLA